MTNIHTQMNKVEGDPAILYILYSVIANELPNDVPSNLCSVTYDLLQCGIYNL